MSERGFTLIELLTAMVLIAVLSAISLKMVDARKQAYLAVMESDLQHIALAQEIYYAHTLTNSDQPEYANTLSDLDFSPSPNVQITLVGIKQGWTARAQHKLRTDFRCAVYFGDITALIVPLEPAIEEAVIECEPKSRAGVKAKGG
jgi:prepilin-type N-terminal cleavage/methylation domain-containing protein